MKRIIFVLIALIVCFSFTFHAWSVVIDGNDGSEWHNSTSYILVNGESNSSIDYCILKVKFDADNSAIYLCAMMTDENLTVDNVYAGASVSVNGSPFFTVTKNNTPCNNDINNYSFDGAVSVDENNGATVEMRIGFKSGIPKTVECVIQLIDSNGEPSNYYNLNLINESYVEPTAMDIAPTKDNSDPYYNPELLNSTKKSTTKKKSSKTTKREEETTRRKKKATTVATTERWVVPDSPMIYTGRTKPPKTAKQEVVTVQSGGVTVYYYEKEVVISQVPVIISVTDASTDTSIVTETHSQLSSTVQSVASTSTELTTVTDTHKIEPETSATFSQGAKFKKISFAAGAVAFVIISCLGVRLVKKEK